MGEKLDDGLSETERRQLDAVWKRERRGWARMRARGLASAVACVAVPVAITIALRVFLGPESSTMAAVGFHIAIWSWAAPAAGGRLLHRFLRSDAELGRMISLGLAVPLIGPLVTASNIAGLDAAGREQTVASLLYMAAALQVLGFGLWATFG